LEEIVAAPVYKTEISGKLAAVGIRCADHTIIYTRSSRHCFAGCGGRSFGIVHFRAESHGVCLLLIMIWQDFILGISSDIISDGTEMLIIRASSIRMVTVLNI
jgi:hypothetical protein